MSRFVIQLSGVNDISRLISDEAGKQITKDQNLQKLVAELLEKDLRIHIKGKEIVLSSLHIVHGPIKTIEEMVYSHPYVVLAACIVDI
ncbi:hypothetical protein MAR_003381 [Mya arenaria]|uniref:Uncharacterized protein n=1 Tax=Mya arenaria TaxID=6604 RepID=A0ABY7G9C6_MYAAR|nr:hypothetical protein MAR_003381 [Mya arenaria]